MATIRNRADLPDIDKPIADIIESLGFRWEYETDYPLPDLGKRVQVRLEKNYVPSEMVTELRLALQRGVKIKAIVVTKDGHLLDGNTTTEAARKNKMPTLHAFVLDRAFEGPPGPALAEVHKRLFQLGLKLNLHGKRRVRAETRTTIERIGPDAGWEAKRVAEHCACTEGFVQSVWAQQRAKGRMDKLGLHVNGNLTDSQMRVLGTAQLNDRPFRMLTKLTEDAGLSPEEQRTIIKRIKEARDDEAALSLLEQEYAARADQIAEYRARGRSKPPVAGLARQRAGFFLKYEDEPTQLCEHNPTLVAEHVATMQRLIAVLQKVVDAHVAAGEVEV